MQLTTAGPREAAHVGSRNSTQIKREITPGEMLSSVTVNTHFPAAKRLKMEGCERSDSFACLQNEIDSTPPHLSSLSVQPDSLTPHSVSRAASSTPLVSSPPISSPANHAFPSSPAPSVQDNTHYGTPSRACQAEKHSYHSSGTLPTRTENIQGIRDNIRIGEDLRDVHVDMPDHINQCLGLFKDCTIQNVTINIYLDKERQDT